MVKSIGPIVSNHSWLAVFVSSEDEPIFRFAAVVDGDAKLRSGVRRCGQLDFQFAIAIIVGNELPLSVTDLTLRSPKSKSTRDNLFKATISIWAWAEVISVNCEFKVSETL